jgi:hypothetical protein
MKIKTKVVGYCGLAGFMVIILGGYVHNLLSTPQLEFFPLHPQDTWTYQVQRPAAGVSFPMTVTVKGEQYIEPLHTYGQLVEESHLIPLVIQGEPTPRPQEYAFPVAYYVHEGFVHRNMSLSYINGHLEDSDLGSAETQFLPLFLHAGTDWESYLNAYETNDRLFGQGGRHRHHAVREDTLIEVPAGYFRDCLRVETEAVSISTATSSKKTPQQGIKLYYLDWYAPHVGLVKSVQQDKAAGGTEISRMELVAYHVQP